MGKHPLKWGYRQYIQIRGNLKWQIIWSFLEPYWKEWILPYWKWLLGAVLSVTGSALAYIWEWVTGLHPLLIFFIFFGIYVLSWALVALVVFVLRGWKQPSVGGSPVSAPLPTSPQKREQDSAEHFAETIHSLQQLLDTLKNYRGDQAHVLVAYVNIKHRPLADKIATIFTQAEWKTDFRDRPLDTHLPLFTEGTVIYGCNSKLVSTVFNALRVAGLSEIEATIEESKHARNTPKWDQEQHSLRIRIGYQ